jgi:hypothetical protein
MHEEKFGVFPRRQQGGAADRIVAEPGKIRGGQNSLEGVHGFSREKSHAFVLNHNPASGSPSCGWMTARGVARFQRKKTTNGRPGTPDPSERTRTGGQRKSRERPRARAWQGQEGADERRAVWTGHLPKASAATGLVDLSRLIVRNTVS